MYFLNNFDLKILIFFSELFINDCWKNNSCVSVTSESTEVKK